VASADSPRIDYILHCQGCHRPDGAGIPGTVPALKNHVGKFLRVPSGRAYLVQVPGTAQSSLTDAEVAGVLNWMLETFSAEQLPADFEPYTEEEVARLRVPLLEVREVRRQLVEQIAALREKPQRAR
jgi:mono/diheme cytochrome c family protein